MREIKFRGKRVDNGEWAYGCYYHDYTYSGCMITNSNGWRPSYNDPDTGECNVDHEIDGSTLGQFTGLHDKNGKEIFEGDVCDYRGSIKSVKFGGGYADIKGSGHGEDWSEIPTSFSIGGEPLGLWKCEIIGTIHTTPELLEGGES